MLEKLLKYDLKSIYKILFVFYSLAIIFAIIGKSCSVLSTNSTIMGIVSKIANGFSVGMIISLFINSLIRTWIRFKTNLYGDESYLTHTLPIEKKTIYLSKVLTSIITLFTSVLISTICIAIMYYSKENLEVLKTSISSVASMYNSSLFELLFIVFTIFFFEILFINIIGYVGIIIGHKSNDHKVIKSIVYGYVLYMLTQALALGIIFIVGLFNNDLMKLFTTSTTVSIDAIKLVMYLGTFMYLIYIIIFYIIGKKLFNKGVNVD